MERGSRHRPRSWCSAPPETWRRASSIPALTELAKRNQLPHQFAVIGVARTEMSDEDFAARAPELAARGVSFHYVAGILRRRRHLRAAARGARGLRCAAPDVGQPALLPGHGAHRVRQGGDPARCGGPGRGAAGHLPAVGDREAVRAGPRERRSARRRAARGVPRAPDLPDRPLPREGDGAEHPGAAVRERDLRAALEPPVRGARRAHRRRVTRGRPPEHVLRAGRSAARHRAEPPPAGARPHRDGAAGELLGRRGARREGQAPALHPAAAAVGPPPAHRARPVRRRRGGR